MDRIVSNTLEALKKNNFDAEYFESSKAAIDAILKEIDIKESVGIGGSMTVKTLELDKRLKERGNVVHWHWLESTSEGMDSARENAAKADVYLTSTNALTQDGKLINIDGTGNRVAAMIYGPKRTIIICGINKIVENLDTAFERIEKNTYKNARRLNLKTPCAINENCIDCNSPQRMCNVTTIINKKPGKRPIKVIIINEELGF
ncbi:MAG: lactate utilization protein [Lutisporaceae bacterium]